MRVARGWIDRFLVATYLGLVGAGCAGGAPAPVMPLGGQPATAGEALGWFDGIRAPSAVVHRFRWLYRDREQSAGGRGSARITPGDSLRFDVAGPLGSGRGAAFVVGDSARWAQPEEDVRKLVPNYPLLWAMMGVARLPARFTEVTKYEDGKLTAWRFTNGADTVEFARMAGPPIKLIADVREGGERVGRVETLFNVDGTPKSARLDVPRTPARLDITYGSSTKATGFPPDTWVPPQP